MNTTSLKLFKHQFIIIHIPLPEQLNTVKSMLEKVGMSRLLEDLELKLNRAAEVATPKAKKLFWEAITDMSFDDVKTIYKGPEDNPAKRTTDLLKRVFGGK